MTDTIEWIDRPDCPLAHHFQIYFCNSEICGPHLVLFDKDNKPICEMVIPRRECVRLSETIRKFGHDA